MLRQLRREDRRGLDVRVVGRADLRPRRRLAARGRDVLEARHGNVRLGAGVALRLADVEGAEAMVAVGRERVGDGDVAEGHVTRVRDRDLEGMRCNPFCQRRSGDFGLLVDADLRLRSRVAHDVGTAAANRVGGVRQRVHGDQGRWRRLPSFVRPLSSSADARRVVGEARGDTRECAVVCHARPCGHRAQGRDRRARSVAVRREPGRSPVTLVERDRCPMLITTIVKFAVPPALGRLRSSGFFMIEIFQRSARGCRGRSVVVRPEAG